MYVFYHGRNIKSSYLKDTTLGYKENEEEYPELILPYERSCEEIL